MPRPPFFRPIFRSLGDLPGQVAPDEPRPGPVLDSLIRLDGGAGYCDLRTYPLLARLDQGPDAPRTGVCWGSTARASNRSPSTREAVTWPRRHATAPCTSGTSTVASSTLPWNRRQGPRRSSRTAWHSRPTDRAWAANSDGSVALLESGCRYVSTRFSLQRQGHSMRGETQERGVAAEQCHGSGIFTRGEDARVGHGRRDDRDPGPGRRRTILGMAWPFRRGQVAGLLPGQPDPRLGRR